MGLIVFPLGISWQNPFFVLTIYLKSCPTLILRYNTSLSCTYLGLWINGNIKIHPTLENNGCAVPFSSTCLIKTAQQNSKETVDFDKYSSFTWHRKINLFWRKKIFVTSRDSRFLVNWFGTTSHVKMLLYHQLLCCGQNAQNRAKFSL